MIAGVLFSRQEAQTLAAGNLKFGPPYWPSGGGSVGSGANGHPTTRDGSLPTGQATGVRELVRSGDVPPRSQRLRDHILKDPPGDFLRVLGTTLGT